VRCKSTGAGFASAADPRGARGESPTDGTDELLERIKEGVAGTRNRSAASCSETADNLSGYLEDDLAFPRRRRVARHLRRCIRCQSLLDSLAWTVEQLRTLGASEHRLPSLADEVIERIRRETARRPS
jgi:hypothetical protein